MKDLGLIYIKHKIVSSVFLMERPNVVKSADYAENKIILFVSVNSYENSCGLCEYSEEKKIFNL